MTYPDELPGEIEAEVVTIACRQTSPRQLPHEAVDRDVYFERRVILIFPEPYGKKETS